MKSAYELAMEKLRRQDAERGESEERLTDAQRAEIAELRQFHKARMAEREILHKAELRKAGEKRDPEALRALEEGYQRERARLEEDLEAKVRKVRSAGAR